MTTTKLLEDGDCTTPNYVTIVIIINFHIKYVVSLKTFDMSEFTIYT